MPPLLFSPPRPFSRGAVAGFGVVVVVWFGFVGCFGVFFGGGEGRLDQGTTNKSTVSTSQTMNEEKTPPHPDGSKTNTCTGKEDGATADFTRPNSSSLVGTEQ